MLTPEQVREQIGQVRSRASGPINRNFFCHHMPEGVDDSAWRRLLQPYYEEFGVGSSNGGAVRLPFDAAMAAREADVFVREVLVEGLGVSALVVGEDFVFGKGRGGNLQTLRREGARHGFDVTAFHTVLAAGGQKVSSTRIREALKQGHPLDAAKLLGRHWAVEARVEHGDGRGRTMGFPTANMHLGHCLAPAFGIYAVRATIFDTDQAPDGETGERHDGVASFGVRPMYAVQTPLMETHLFDFDGDLYGRHLSVELVDYIRPEMRFSGLPALIAQIADDCQAARALLARHPRAPALHA